MEDIVVHSVGPMKESAFVRPMQVTYSQKGGAARKWDYIRVHDSVSILIFDVTLKCMIVVKQFRPAVYMHECHGRHERHEMPEQTNTKTVPETSKEVSPSLGVVHELCAGIIDKSGKSTAEIAAMEVLEETGYRIPPEKLELISKCRSAVGTCGSLQSLFYAEVSEDMKAHEGGGLESEGEMIETVKIPMNQIEAYADDKERTDRPSGILFALNWFLRKKKHLYS